MGTLKNPRHEAYAQNLTKGMSQREAYRDAFPRSADSAGKEVDNRASILAKNDEILMRMEELKAAAADETVADANEVLAFFTETLRAENTDTVVTAIGGTVEIPPSIKDRIKAADNLAKFHGLYDNKLKLEGSLPVMIIDDIPESD